MRQDSSQPCKPSYRSTSRDQSPQSEQNSNWNDPATNQDHADCNGHHDQRYSHQNPVQVSANERANYHCSDQSCRTYDKQQHRERGHVNVRHCFQERPQISKQRELPHEEEGNSCHTKGDLFVSKQAQCAIRRNRTSLTWHLRQREGLPDQSQRGQRHHAEECSSPPNHTAQVTTDWGRNCRGQCSTALHYGYCPGNERVRRNPHHHSGGHRPVPTNGNPEDGSSHHQRQIIWGKCHHSPGDKHQCRSRQ
ncbi:hypothetical protein D9M71_407940 [compost metagenome]